MARAQWTPPASETTPSLQSPFRNQLWLPAERPERSTPVTGATRTPQVDLSGLAQPSPSPEEAVPVVAPSAVAADPELPPPAPPAEEAPAEEAPAEGATPEGQSGKRGKKKAAEPKAGE